MDQLELESLLAAVGPESILRGRPTLHKYQLQRAAEMPRDIRRRMLRFLATDSFAEADDLAPFDYEDVLSLVSSETGLPEAQALTAAVPGGDMATDLDIEANRIRTWAGQAIPRPEPVGGQLEDPDPGRLADFRRSWAVATDPLVVLRDLAAGMLAPDQVATLAVLYPSLYAEIRQTFSAARAATAGRRGKTWKPSPAKQAQLDVLLQQDTTDPSLAAAVQGVYAAEAQREQQQAAPPPRRPSSSAPATDGLTPGQQAAAGA